MLPHYFNQYQNQFYITLVTAIIRRKPNGLHN